MVAYLASELAGMKVCDQGVEETAALVEKIALLDFVQDPYQCLAFVQVEQMAVLVVQVLQVEIAWETNHNHGVPWVHLDVAEEAVHQMAVD